MATFLAVNYVSAQGDIVLGADVTAGATSFTVTVPTIQTGFGIVNPSGVGIYKCVIESEIIHFTSGAVTAGTQTWTMARAQEGTTGVIHTAGTVIKLENTAGAWGNALQLSPTAQQTGDANISGTVTAGTALSGPLAASNLTGSVAIARLPTETSSADTSSAHLVTADDTRLSNTRTPTAHASSHVDSDSILAYMAAALAQMTGHLMVPFDLRPATGIVAPTAGVLKMTKLLTPYAFTINTIDLLVRQAGTGVTSLANCFLTIFDSSGQRQYLSADQSSSWNSLGTKSLSVAGGYTVTAGSYIYVAVLVGTQSSTTVQFASINASVTDPWTINQTAASYGSATNSSALTSVPGSITLSSNAAATSGIWFGVR